MFLPLDGDYFREEFINCHGLSLSNNHIPRKPSHHPKLNTRTHPGRRRRHYSAAPNLRKPFVAIPSKSQEFFNNPLNAFDNAVQRPSRTRNPLPLHSVLVPLERGLPRRQWGFHRHFQRPGWYLHMWRSPQRIASRNITLDEMNLTLASGPSHHPNGSMPINRAISQTSTTATAALNSESSVPRILPAFHQTIPKARTDPQTSANARATFISQVAVPTPPWRLWRVLWTDEGMRIFDSKATTSLTRAS